LISSGHLVSFHRMEKGSVNILLNLCFGSTSVNENLIILLNDATI